MKKIRQRGFLLTDLLTAVALLGLIIMLLAASIVGFARFNHYQWARQRCTAAAQAQLDSLTATATTIGPEELKRLWPEVDVSLERTPADAPWKGLERVRVTAATSRTAVRLTRYIPIKPAQVAEGGRL